MDEQFTGVDEPAVSAPVPVKATVEPEDAKKVPPRLLKQSDHGNSSDDKDDVNDEIVRRRQQW